MILLDVTYCSFLFVCQRLHIVDKTGSHFLQRVFVLWVPKFDPKGNSYDVLFWRYSYSGKDGPIVFVDLDYTALCNDCCSRYKSNVGWNIKEAKLLGDNYEYYTFVTQNIEAEDEQLCHCADLIAGSDG